MLKEARETALAEMAAEASARGCNAVIGVDLDYENVGADGGGMLMVSASGTAVRIE